MSSVSGSDGVVGEEREEVHVGLESSGVEEALQCDGELPHQSDTV